MLCNLDLCIASFTQTLIALKTKYRKVKDLHSARNNLSHKYIYFLLDQPSHSKRPIHGGQYLYDKVTLFTHAKAF